MNFIEATRAMLHGARMRRPCHVPELFVTADERGYWDHLPIGNGDYAPAPDDVLATDWEVTTWHR